MHRQSSSRLFTALVVVLLSVDLASSAAIHRRIIAGTNADSPKPYLFNVFETTFVPAFNANRTNVICSGAFIAPNLVLTAAHCVPDFANSTSKTRVRYSGRYNISAAPEAEGAIEWTFVDIITHPEYRKSKATDNNPANDIAVMIVRKANAERDTGVPEIIKYNRDISRDSVAGSVLHLDGFGTIDANLATIPQVLQQADMKIIEKAACLGSNFTLGSKPHANVTTVTDRAICVQHDGGLPAPCTGDSGSPVISKDENGQPLVVGVISFHDLSPGDGIRCGSPKAPEVLASVASMVDFVDEMVRNYATATW
ncbi:trypsin-like cysteine/serine peptidase domain-containing protein [Cladochytrium replicatum]|nr:trypsin-like cysteine/serine peptidase domain-containing protein [Cladochytrium replicatum]